MSQSELLWPETPETLDQLVVWIKEAGQIALSHFEVLDKIQFKPDHTFVTEADLQIEAFLVNKLRAAFPDYGLIAEEGARAGQVQSSKYTWAIDPLDGTTAFTQGLPGWGIAIGLLHHDQPCFGLFYMPLLDDLTCSRAILNKDVLRSDWSARGFLAVSASSHRTFEFEMGYIRTLGSASASLVYTARGSATAAFLPRVRLWDLVAGAAILHRVGGELRYLSGEPIDYRALRDGSQAPESVIAGHPVLLDELKRAIRRRV